MKNRAKIDPILDRIRGSLIKSNSFLSIAIDGVPDNPSVIRSWYLRAQAQVINDICSDICYLIQDRRLLSIPALTRVAFEASVKIEAAVKVQDYVAQQYLSEQLEIVREFEMLVKSGAASYQTDLDSQAAVLSKLRIDLDGVRERKWKFSETVVAAGLKEESDDQYPMLSQAIHSTVRGMTAFKNEALSVWCLPHLLKSVIRALEHLVFFKDGGTAEARPISANYLQIVNHMANLMDEWDRARQAVTKLLRSQS